MDEIYGVKEEFNTLTYDLDLHMDNSDLDISCPIHDNVDTIQDNSSSKSMLNFFPSISKAELGISTFVCTQQDEYPVHLDQLSGKVLRTWHKSLIKSPLKVNPHYALDSPTYQKTTKIYSFLSSVIHASYLYSIGLIADFNVPPQLNIHPDSTVRIFTIGNLSLNSLIDTGCHKTLLHKKVYDANISLFANIYKVPFLEKHTITVGNGQQLVADFMLALPILIQNHWFEFLVLVVGCFR